MEDRRQRVAILLSEDDLTFLRWWSAEVAHVPSEVARGMVERGLEHARHQPGIAARYEAWRTGRTIEDAVVNDVVAAMSTPGVPAILSGDLRMATNAAAKAAAFLVDLSRWLEDERAVADKGPWPRLRQAAPVPPFPADVGSAIDLARGADGRTVRRSRANGTSVVSDKRQLLDMAQMELPGAADGS